MTTASKSLNEMRDMSSLAGTSDCTDFASKSKVQIGLSVVIPVYRGAATVGCLVHALSELRVEGGLEIVLVNDGSPDHSSEVCRALLHEISSPITYIELTRNFGEHNAILAGLRHARGSYIITMDDDLQNPSFDSS